MSNSTEERSTVALFASPSKVPALLQWMRDHAGALDSADLLAPASLVLMLNLDLQVGFLSVQAISPGDSEAVDDIILANQVLENKIQGVVYFYDGSESSDSLNVLTRACNAAGVPLAINEATGSMALKGVVKTKTAYLIFNPVAGQGDSMVQLKQIRSMLESRMILHVVMTQKDRECADQAREIVNMIKATPEYEKDPEATLIIASGGDGTVSAVAGETMSSGIPFGIIPRGTANAFSVALGVPIPVLEACRNILDGNILTVDGAMCNEIPMILLAGLGFEAGMVKNASRELKDVLGCLAYVLGGAKQVIDQQPFKCNVTIDGTSDEIEATAVTVANVAPPTSLLAQGFGEVLPDDGLLDVTVATSKNLFQGISDLGALLTSAVVKQPTASETLLCVRAKKITVSCDPPQKVVIDGEMLDMNPINFSVVPGGLKVLAPKKD